MLDDVLDGFVSVEAAQSSHGVVIDPVTVVVDQRHRHEKRPSKVLGN